jgi:hypothetical protein
MLVFVRLAQHYMQRTLRHVPFRRSFWLFQFSPFRRLVRVASAANVCRWAFGLSFGSKLILKISNLGIGFRLVFWAGALLASVLVRTNHLIIFSGCVPWFPALVIWPGFGHVPGSQGFARPGDLAIFCVFRLAWGGSSAGGLGK